MPRRARRTFTPQFKAEVVLALLTGQQSAAELCRTHQLSPNLLSLWKETYLDRLPVVFQADEQHSAELARIAELEQLVGRQALELEILKKRDQAVAEGAVVHPAGAERRVRLRHGGRAGGLPPPPRREAAAGRPGRGQQAAGRRDGRADPGRAGA